MTPIGHFHKTIPNKIRGECMSGSVHCYKGSWYVAWYDRGTKRNKKIYRYKDEKMYHRKIAMKLLAVMQSEVENGTFYIDKYTTKGFSDIISFIENWLKTSKDGLSPATYKGYKSYIKNHIKPFFVEHNQLSLHDIQIDTLRALKSSLKNNTGSSLSPKMKMNVLYCMHTILDAAWEARKITAIPPFPKKKEYQYEPRPIQWLPEVRQLNILEQIPEEHQPIFYFLKYHLRRPAEACALQKEDYKDSVFTIRRSISAGQLTGKTKTGEIHIIPCLPVFEAYLKIERQKQIKYKTISNFFFINPLARKKGKRYTNDSLNIIWKKACKLAGEDIDLYSGLKHSSCSQYINEKGLSESELQVITDHARLESVRNYAKTDVNRKKELMMKNVYKLDKKRKTLN